MAQFVTGQKYKVHNSYIWLNGLSAALAIFVIGGMNILPALMEAGSSVSRRSGSNLMLAGALGLAGCLLVVGVVFLLQFLAYKNLSYEFDEREFTLNSGIITKKTVHVPYARVQSVDHHASLLQRIVGVCSVTIETAGGAANKAVRIPYVQNYATEMIRAELFERKEVLNAQATGQPPAPAPGTAVVGAAVGSNVAAAQTSGAATSNQFDQVAGTISSARGIAGGTQYVDNQVVTYEYGLSGKELGLSAISGSAIIGTLWSLVVILVLEIVFTVGASGFSSMETTTVVGMIGGVVVSSTVVLFIFLIAMTILGTCLNYGNFKARRHGSRIEVERGVIQRQFSGIDIDRVQSVIVKQSFIRRLMGYCEITLGRIDSAADNKQNKQQARALSQGMVIHPFVKVDKVPEILAGLIPEYADTPDPEALTSLPKVAVRRAVVRRCIWRGEMFWGALIVAAIQILIHLLVDGAPATDYDARMIAEFMPQIDTLFTVVYVFCALSLIIRAVGSVLWARSSGFAYNKRFMCVRNGGFGRETVSFPRQKIQFGFTRANPFQETSHVATINAVNASGVGGTNIRLWDVGEEDAVAWLNWLKPGGNVIE